MPKRGSPRHARIGTFRVSAAPVPGVAWYDRDRAACAGDASAPVDLERSHAIDPAFLPPDECRTPDGERVRRAARLAFLIAAAEQGYPHIVDSMACVIEENQHLRELVQCLVERDPSEIVAGRMRFLDVWRQQARAMLDLDVNS